MNTSRKLVSDLIAGVSLSGIFFALLVNSMMEAGVSSGAGFLEFILATENLMFCSVMSSFIFASWLIRGTNDRMVLFIWALGFVIHHGMYWLCYELFFNQTKNIYALNFIGSMATVPVVVLLRYRLLMVFKLTILYQRCFGMMHNTQHILSQIKSTDFEYYANRACALGLFVELCYSLYLSVYALIHHIPYNGSIYQHFVRTGNWNPFDTYYSALDLVSLSFIAILMYYIYRSLSAPDVFAYSVEKSQKRKIAELMLEKRRSKHNIVKKERD